MNELTVATYNLGDGPDAEKARDLDRLKAEGADVICLQEAGDRGKMLKAWARRNGWELWRGLVPGAASVPILYRGDLPVTRRFSRIAVPRMYVGPGAGPSWAKTKAVVGIRIGRTVVLNTHKVASVTRKGKQYRFRRAHYRLHVAVDVRMVRRRRARGLNVILVGDFNAPPSFTLLEPIWDLCPRQWTRQWTRQPTHENRMIDLIWTWGLHLAVRNQAPARVVPDGYSSDHRPSLATLTDRSTI